MSIFGRTDKDLNLLRLPATDLRAIEQHVILDQLFHHCIRLAWREHARTGAPVRDLLRQIMGAAAIRLYEACPDEEFDDELLSIIIHDALAENELHICLGFLLKGEAKALCDAAFEGPLPPRYSIFEGRPGLLTYLPSRAEIALAALLKLHDLWNDYRRNVASDPLARETVRIVANVTGEDPNLSDCFVLNNRIALLRWAVAELAAA